VRRTAQSKKEGLKMSQIRTAASIVGALLVLMAAILAGVILSFPTPR
jgi:hypothetical protein